ncbi:hypothetical protein PsorP6_003009 [Peronosclerospora sorghi]|uniref:Uncharacterized protein n=1 Tax=Peronosclerospora sorghi TaxID=230839 RepID=A0ACC0VQA1_9STRA|nr:hypothetical protein PsorP6_003009 [Peronosclerospora sorghi]
MFRDLDEQEGVAYTVNWLDGDPNSQKMEGLYVTHNFGNQMLKNYPLKVMFDNTYQTNKYRMDFFQVIVMTPFDHSASIACVLINKELEAGFDWLMEQYR